ncbi:MAG TPA: Dyp-type peroxidase [Candidatus Acidoferrum sp.]|nr:Dyp-type peroxidase [Candidatus Acidoferrum sp.]
MTSPQSGIFALGTSSHAYLEFDLEPGKNPHALATALADAREPRTTIGGVNFVSGFRPELWRELVPDGLPNDVVGFNHDLVGADGYVAPATQHDAVLWLSGSSYDVVFDEARQVIKALTPLSRIADETSGWSYRRYRDLTGFVDGTENPSLLDAPGIVVIPEGSPGAGGTILLLQQWAHDVTAWESLPVASQEKVMGRTKPESTELDPKPPDSHVGKTDQDELGKIFRRNVPYGTVTDHGTMFVGFCAAQRPLQAMLESMLGTGDGVRDALTRYTRPVTGAYYFIPSTDVIRQFASSDAAD